MPRKERENGRRWLRNQLLRCGFSGEDADEKILYLSLPHITSTDLFVIGEIVSKVQQKFKAEKQVLENALENEKRARKRIVALVRGIPEQVERVESDEALAEFRHWLAEHPPV